MLAEVDKEKTGFVDVMEFSKICFNVKEEKPKGEAKKGKDAAKKKKWIYFFINLKDMSESVLMSHFEKWHGSGCDELSVWLFSGKRSINFVASNPKSIPKLNSNNTYIICQAQHNVQVLGDAGYDSLKIFFWVGQRCEDHENAFE